jgi:hypothetical protein
MSRPLRSTPTPASRDLIATTSRSACERRIGTQCLRFLPLAHSLSRPWRPSTPIAPSTLAFSRSVQEPQTGLTPPLRRTPPGQERGHPPGSSRGKKQGPRFRCQPNLFDASTTTLNQVTPGQALLERLPGPHLTQSSHAFSLSLSTTVFSQRTTGWFSARPRRADAGGPTSLHLSHDTAYESYLLHDASFSVRDTRFTATTGRSAPVPRIGTQPLTASTAWGSPVHNRPQARSPLAGREHAATGSHVPHRSPDQARAASMPDTTWPVSRHPPGSSRSSGSAPVSMSSFPFRHVISGSLTFAFLADT